MLIFLSRKSSNFFYIFLMYMCEFFENFLQGVRNIFCTFQNIIIFAKKYNFPRIKNKFF